jgi:hypothetical protein
MSNFTLSWFKRQAELENLIIEEQQLKNAVLRQQVGDVPTTTDTTTPMNYGNPYKSVKLVNDLLIVVLQDGSVLSKTDATADDFNRVRNAVSESSVFDIMATPELREERQKQEAEVKRLQTLQQGIKKLEGLYDFEIDGNSVKLRGTGRTMPQLLVERFIEIVDAYEMDPYNDVTDDEEYQALKRFFMWCCLNPRAEVANDLYDFLNSNSFRITKQGFFVALRNVVTLHGGTELVQFVSNAYNKVKAVWKKSPDKYTVFKENGEYKLVHDLELYETVEGYDDETGDSYEEEVYADHGERIGGLTELYLDLPNRHENRFTDAHTQTFDIRIGRVVNMPPNECNWSTADCAHAGLHFTADHINYVGCGDQSVLVLINPMKVVGIGEHKGRCYEYLPIMTVSTEESTTILHDLDFDTLELDESFAIHELQDLTERAKEGFITEAKKHEFNIPAITHSQIENIVASLNEMKDQLSKRIVNID